MWLIWALASAFLSGTTVLLAKSGTRKVPPDWTVALRSTVILAFAWLTVLFTGSYKTLVGANFGALVFPLLSGITNSFAWICYFKALRLGSIDKVAPIDKAGITLTMIGGWLFLKEEMTAAKIISIIMILIGAALMTERRAPTNSKENSTNLPSAPFADRAKPSTWLIWALASAVLAAATTILSKMGVNGMSSETAFGIRAGVMFVIAWSLILFKGKLKEEKSFEPKSVVFVGLSGLTTAVAWLCYFKALSFEQAEAGIVQPIDKLSILVSVLGARLIFKEELKRRGLLGLAVLTAGIIVLIL